MKYRFVCLFVAVLLSGCAGLPTPGTPDDGSPSPDKVLEAVPKSAMSGNRAVIALLDRARTDKNTGQHEAAGASLERALRIEPRNPWLWLELAQLRLNQGQYAQAITLSRKSNSFAGNQFGVQALSWQIIGQARSAQGDSAGAEQAYQRAAELDQQAEKNR